jgi:DNA-binding MarR family transcriptional regulator
MKASMPVTRPEPLLQAFFEMGRKLKGALARDFAPFSALHVETLRFISESKTPSMRELADYLKVSAPSATTLTDGLVEDGYIERKVDAEDRRLVRLALSAKGKKLVADLHQKRMAAFSRLVAPLTPAEQHDLARLLRIITQN